MIKISLLDFDSHKSFSRITVKSIYNSTYSILILNISSFDCKLFKIVSFRLEYDVLVYCRYYYIYIFTVILEKDLCESKCIEFELY